MHSFDIGVDSNKVTRCYPSPWKHTWSLLREEKTVQRANEDLLVQAVKRFISYEL